MTSFSRSVKRLSALTAIGAIASLGIAGVAVAATNGEESGGHRVLHLTARTVQEVQIEAPHAENLLGGRFVGSDDLYDGDRPAGHLGHSCEAVADLGTQGARFQCVATVELDDGLITGQFMAIFTPDGNEDAESAITGGTGAYRHARGTVAVHPTSPTDRQVTIDLR
jgi:hypothetical protein